MIFDAGVNADELLFLCDPINLGKEDCFLIKTIDFQKGDKTAEEIRKFDAESKIILDNKVNFV